MQLLQFPRPETAVKEQVVTLLETALDMARRGEIVSTVVVILDDREGEDRVGMLVATDGWVQTAGMLAAANKAL
jgi:hypothetical protein